MGCTSTRLPCPPVRPFESPIRHHSDACFCVSRRFRKARHAPAGGKENAVRPRRDCADRTAREIEVDPEIPSLSFARGLERRLLERSDCALVGHQALGNRGAPTSRARTSDARTSDARTSDARTSGARTSGAPTRRTRCSAAGLRIRGATGRPDHPGAQAAAALVVWRPGVPLRESVVPHSAATAPTARAPLIARLVARQWLARRRAVQSTCRARSLGDSRSTDRDECRATFGMLRMHRPDPRAASRTSRRHRPTPNSARTHRARALCRIERRHA